MAVAVVSELIASSPTSWEEAARKGLERARQTVRNITGVEVVSQKAKVEGGEIKEFRVELKVTFILEEPGQAGKAGKKK